MDRRLFGAAQPAMFVLAYRPKCFITHWQSRLASSVRAYQKWIPEEIERAQKLVKDSKTSREIHRHFPHRSYASVHGLCCRLRRQLGLKISVPWSNEEVAALKQASTSTSFLRNTADAVPGRSLQAKRAVLSARRKDVWTYNKGDPITPEIFEVMRRLREDSKLSWPAIGEALHRNPHSLSTHYYTSRSSSDEAIKTLKKWTEADKALLKQLILDRYAIKQIAKHMGRSISSVADMRRELAHKEPGLIPGQHWDQKQDAVLWNARSSGASVKQIQGELFPQKTYQSIVGRLFRLRYLKQLDFVHDPRPKPAPWSPDEDEIIRDGVVSGLRIKQIWADRLPHRTRDSVLSRSYKLKQRGFIPAPAGKALNGSADIEVKTL